MSTAVTTRSRSDARTSRRTLRGRPLLYTRYADELKIFTTRPKLVWTLLAILAASVLPLGLERDMVSLLSTVCAFAIGGIGLNILTGYAGQVSLGHAFFLGLGAYTAAVLGGRPSGGVIGLEWDMALWLPLAGIVPALHDEGLGGAEVLVRDDDAGAFLTTDLGSSSLDDLVRDLERRGRNGTLDHPAVVEVRRYLHLVLAVLDPDLVHGVLAPLHGGQHTLAQVGDVAEPRQAHQHVGALVAHAEKKLGVKLGGTTGDGRITLVREEECLAGCCGAPMAVVDGHYKEHLDIEKLDALLDGLE